MKKALYEKKLTAKAIDYDEKNGAMLSVNYKL